MKTLTVSDGGHRFTLLVKEDLPLAPLPEKETPPHQKFLSWWKDECHKMGIPYPYRIAEPQGIRIVQSLLKKHDLHELQRLGSHFLLDHGHRLREDGRHFSIFASIVPTLEKELRRE